MSQISANRDSARSVDDVLALAIEHMQGGRLPAAQSLLASILRKDPGHFDSLHLLGVCLHIQGQYAEADRLIGAALRIDPNCAPAHVNRGNALRSMGQIESALESFSRACLLDPSLAVAHTNRALALAELQRLDEATDALDRALALDRGDPEALALRANLLQRKRESDAALYRKGLGLLEQHEAEQAAVAIQTYLQRQPEDAGAWNDLGVAFNQLSRFEQAPMAFSRAIALAPNMAKAHSNLGNALYRAGRFAESEASYLRSLQIDPTDHLCRWNLGLCRLVQGDLLRGWPDYEARGAQRDSVNFAPRDFFDRPWWRGEQSPAGRTILLHAEQGLGDALQFSRYVPLVVALGTRVILEVHPPLHELMRRAFGPGVVTVPRGQSLPPFDLHCPLMSLPLAFATTLDTVPAPIPYLSACAQRVHHWQARLGAKTRPRIGLVWSGGTRHPFDSLRNVPLQTLLALERCDVEFIGLQTEVRESDRPALDRFRNLRWLGESIADFEDTAALVRLCDRVISVDTAVVHLAGALGQPVWVLLPFAPDWRWLLERGDSPWYPTARLFRQTHPEAWDPVVQRLVQELTA